MCLPLLPADNISAMFRDLCKEARAVDRVAFKLFMDYFHNQWIVKVNLI